MIDAFEAEVSRRLARSAAIGEADMAPRVRSRLRRAARVRKVCIILAAVVVAALASATLTIGFNLAKAALPELDADAGMANLIWLPLIVAGALVGLLAREAILAIARA